MLSLLKPLALTTSKARQLRSKPPQRLRMPSAPVWLAGQGLKDGKGSAQTPLAAAAACAAFKSAAALLSSSCTSPGRSSPCCICCTRDVASGRLQLMEKGGVGCEVRGMPERDVCQNGQGRFGFEG